MPARFHGWRLYFHPELLSQLAKLTEAAKRERALARGGGTPPTSNQKVLKGLLEYIFERVPADPDSADFRQGKTLGKGRTHWRRAKFGAGRFRLFFRYSSTRRVLIFAWVNDEHTLRTRGAKDDAYAVFGRMLDRGNPPDDWDALLAAASDPGAVSRAKDLIDSARAVQPPPASPKRKSGG